jgi:hypothetical protein
MYIQLLSVLDLRESATFWIRTLSIQFTWLNFRHIMKSKIRKSIIFSYLLFKIVDILHIAYHLNMMIEILLVWW